MARNKITDLNDHLFAQLERLNDEEITSEDLDKEVIKAKAISGIASQIIQANKLHVEAMKIIGKGNINVDDLPTGLGFKQIGPNGIT